MSEKKHYVSNKDLYAAMCEYIKSVKAANEQSQPTPVIPNYIAKAILSIATRIASKHNYRNNRHYEDEMIMDGVENCIRYIKNFNPERSTNPFAYFSQISINAFNRRIEREKKADYIKHKYTQFSQVIYGSEEGGIDLEVGDEGAQSAMNSESVSDFITSFENHMEKKKAKRSKKALPPEEDEDIIEDTIPIVE